MNINAIHNFTKIQSIKSFQIANKFADFQHGAGQKIKTVLPQTMNKPESILPIVTIPLVAYMKTHVEKIKDKLDKEADNISDKSFTDAREKTIEQLKEAGVKRNFDQYIDSTSGGPNQSGKIKIRNISHKGASSDAYEAQGNDSDLTPEMQADIEEIRALDTGLCPQLQKIYDAPPIETPDGVIESIFGELPEGAIADWDFLTVLKGLADELFDIGDWI